MKILNLSVFLAVLSTSAMAQVQQPKQSFLEKLFPKRTYSMRGNVDHCFVRKAKMLPRGSALLTGSGDLTEQGITAVIHAATGSMTRSKGVFEPDETSMKNSIKNSLRLARKFKHAKVAIPFIGGGIFASRMGLSKEELAKLIVKTVMEHKKKPEVVFVLFTDSEAALFDTLVQSGTEKISVKKGSITDFSVHGASAIVNAANMEVMFGGGISGAIGSATGQADEIDDFAKGVIDSIGGMCPEEMAEALVLEPEDSEFEFESSEDEDESVEEIEVEEEIETEEEIEDEYVSLRESEL